MAAPGFSVSELVQVCHRAWTYTIKIKNAPKEFDSFTAEVGSLGSTLKTLERVASKEGSLYKRAESVERQELHDILERCLKTLAELDSLLYKFYPMLDKESKKQFWSRMRWTKVDPQSLRNKLGMYTSSINIFMSTLTHGSLSRIEAATSLTDGEFGKLWRMLGQEVERSGLTALDLVMHRSEIFNQIQQRGDRPAMLSVQKEGTISVPTRGSRVREVPEAVRTDQSRSEPLTATSTYGRLYTIEIESLKRTTKRLEEDIVRLRNNLKQETDMSTLAQKQLHMERMIMSRMDNKFRHAFRQVLKAQGYPRVRIADLMEDFDKLSSGTSTSSNAGSQELGNTRREQSSREETARPVTQLMLNSLDTHTEEGVKTSFSAEKDDRNDRNRSVATPRKGKPFTALREVEMDLVAGSLESSSRTNAKNDAKETTNIARKPVIRERRRREPWKQDQRQPASGAGQGPFPSDSEERRKSHSIEDSFVGAAPAAPSPKTSVSPHLIHNTDAPPFLYDDDLSLDIDNESDRLVRKRKQNTAAARKSREKKTRRFDTIQDESSEQLTDSQKLVPLKSHHVSSHSRSGHKVPSPRITEPALEVGDSVRMEEEAKGEEGNAVLERVKRKLEITPADMPSFLERVKRKLEITPADVPSFLSGSAPYQATEDSSQFQEMSTSSVPHPFDYDAFLQPESEEESKAPLDQRLSHFDAFSQTMGEQESKAALERQTHVTKTAASRPSNPSPHYCSLRMAHDVLEAEIDEGEDPLDVDHGAPPAMEVDALLDYFERICRDD